MSTKKKSSKKKSVTAPKKTPSKKVASLRKQPVLTSTKLRPAFKPSPPKRDAFGRFLAKLKRNALGRFSSPKPVVIEREIKKDAKQVQRTAKAAGKALDRIKSVIAKPAKKSAKKSAKKKASAKKVASKKTPTTRTQAIIEGSNKLDRQRIYTLRDFPFSQGENYASWVNSIEDHADEIDSQLKPDEMFYGMVDGNKTIIPYEDISSVLRKLNEYVEEHVPQGRSKLIEKFGIITFKGSTSQAREERKTLVDKRKKESREAFKVLREQVGATKEEIIIVGGKKMSIQRKKTTAELISDLSKQKKETDARIKALEETLSRFMESNKSVSKKSAKKVAKKSSKKTTRRK